MHPRLYDAHNHLQDERLAREREAILAALARENIAGMVVNGAREADWPQVRALAQRCPRIIPAYGYHPWYVKARSAHWQEVLKSFLDDTPAGGAETGTERRLPAGLTPPQPEAVPPGGADVVSRLEAGAPGLSVGEIGLDRWIEGHDLEDQAEVFTWQLRLAAERNLPASIHCLQAWGRLLEILRAQPLPRCGFLLHSYGGPAEMVGPLAELGARFSLPGYFAHARKTRQREAFRRVPPDRLLIETDAPDQSLPAERVEHPLVDPASGQAINHPANLAAVYRFAAEVTGRPFEALAEQVEENFLRLFGAPPASMRAY